MSASPQKEHGYTPIANEILDQLAMRVISPNERSFLDVLFRQTYGWSRKENFIRLTDVAAATGMSLTSVCHAKKKLVDSGVVAQTGNNISFIKDYTRWEIPCRNNKVAQSSKLPKQASKKKNTAQSSNETLPDQASTPYKANKNNSTYVAERVFIFSPSHPMPDFVVVPDELENQQDKSKKKPQPFNYQDYAELTRLMKKTCGFTTLTNGTKPQDNYARHILMFLLKVLVKEHQWPEAEAIDQIRVNMEEFCQLVQTAREADKWLGQKVTSLQEIYFELKRGRIFEAAKSKKSNPFTTVRI